MECRVGGFGAVVAQAQEESLVSSEERNFGTSLEEPGQAAAAAVDGSDLRFWWYLGWQTMGILKTNHGSMTMNYCKKASLCTYFALLFKYTGWWFATFFIFPYIGNNHPNWLIFFRGVETTNQYTFTMFGGYQQYLRGRGTRLLAAASIIGVHLGVHGFSIWAGHSAMVVQCCSCFLQQLITTMDMGQSYHKKELIHTKNRHSSLWFCRVLNLDSRSPSVMVPFHFYASKKFQPRTSPCDTLISLGADRVPCLW